MATRTANSRPPDYRTYAHSLLGVYVTNLTEYFRVTFTGWETEVGRLPDGTRITRSTTPDEWMTLTIVGDQADISKIVLTLATTGDPGVDEALPAIAGFFSIKALPNWAEGPEQVGNATRAVLSGQQDTVEIVHDKARITFRKSTEHPPVFVITITENTEK